MDARKFGVWCNTGTDRPQLGQWTKGIVMNTLSWLIVASVIGIIAFVTFWDEELNPQAETWLQASHRTVPAVDNGYFNVMGLFAADSDDAHAVGRARVQAYELSRSQYPGNAEPKYVDYANAKRLDLGTELDSLCKVEKRACLNRFAEQTDTIYALAQRHETLLERYLALRQFGSFSTSATASLYEPMLPAKMLSSLQRLHNASLALEFAQGSRLRAVEELAADIRFQRHLLAQADSVVLKILSVEMLARDLHLFSEFLDSVEFVHRYLPNLEAELADLTATERSLSEGIHREFRAMAQLLLIAPTSESIGLDVNVPNWMIGMLYKPNATLNRVWLDFSALHSLAERPISQLKQHWDDAPPAKSTTIEYALNPIGSVLSEVSAPNLQPYIAQLADAAGLLRLVRLKREIHVQGVKAQDIRAFLEAHAATLGDLYEGKPIQWNPQRRTIFFVGLAAMKHLTALEVAGF